MEQSQAGNRFYKIMGVILLIFVITGFGLAAFVRKQNPLELPILYHLHAISYLLWFSLFILQASLISQGNKKLHMTLGKISPLLVIAMLITAWLMAKGSYERGISPIPDISIEQFMAFPFIDLIGLTIFYSLAIAKRIDGDFHKRAMLLALIAIMEPATARIGLSIGFPPFPLLANIGFVFALAWHDRIKLNRVHVITWFGFVWIFLRMGFVFGFAATEAWAAIVVGLFSQN